MGKKKSKKISPYWIVFPGYIPGYEKNIIKRPSTIAWVEADDHYIKIQFKNGKSMTQAVCLKYMEERLNPATFSRSHRSYIFNKHFVKRYYKDKRIFAAEMRDKKKISITRNASEKIENWVKLFRP